MDKIQTYNLISKSDSNFILEPFEVVDKETAHQRNLLHKSAHVLFICGNKILCRYRAKDELRYPDVYTTAIGTHVFYGNDYLETIFNFLPGNLVPVWVGEFFVHDKFENEVNGLYVIKVESGELPKDFLQNRNFFSPRELLDLIAKNKTTPHLAGAFNLIKDNDF